MSNPLHNQPTDIVDILNKEGGITDQKQLLEVDLETDTLPDFGTFPKSAL